MRPLWALWILPYRRVNQKTNLHSLLLPPSSSREDLRNVEANREMITDKTLKYLEQYFDQKLSDRIEAVYIKVMGRAMPIPRPGYLFNDANLKRAYPNLTFRC